MIRWQWIRNTRGYTKMHDHPRKAECIVLEVLKSRAIRIIMTVTNYPHISIAGDGTASIGQSRYKVAHLAAEHYHYGWSAEELLRQHPDLRPEEIYAALTFFYDHYDEMVKAFVLEAEHFEELRRQQKLSRAELLARKTALA